MAVVRAQVASSSTSRCSYQVFLSFRGGDTSKTFTDHLYTALVQAGFDTFRDDDEIERGKKIETELQKAIQQPRISIIVFSKNYASSKWCLNELVMILKHRNASGRLVLPVFYDVDPSEVRKQTGSIGKAFARYEEEFKAEIDHETKNEWMDKVKRWRVALTGVANLAGMVLQHQNDGYESKFIQKVVNVIEDKLNRPVLYVGRYQVGMYYRVKNINLWVQDRSSNVDILVICGMGGIGKTTIAKCVYNSNFRGFESHSFLANIKGTSEQPNGLARLQRQFLSNILKRKIKKIYNTDEGTTQIKEAICCKKILVVLDDVDDVNQVNALLGTREFYPGSKIIITTRDKWLLRAHEIHKVHTVEKLDENESLELFSLHAFGQNHPIEGYIDQSTRVVRHCGGIPLAHEVLGSSLSGKSIDVWESALEKLEAIPEAQILNKLKISYESLPDKHDKNLFLHVACFFVGKDKDDTIKILDKCQFFTIVGIQCLIDRCLVTIDKDNKLMMHHLLQEMGREIVHQESPKEPGRRSRLWNHKDSLITLKEKRGTETIEGLILDMQMFKEDPRSSFNVNTGKKRGYERFHNRSLLSNPGTFSLFSWQSVNTGLRSPEVDMEIDAFERMDKLRLLQINYVQLTGHYENFPEKLRWLCWHGFPFKSIPADFPLGNLVSLDMRYSKLKNVGLGTKILRSLKILNLSHSRGLARTPNFLVLPNLEKLILKGCASLVEVCESIENLEGLTLLNLKDCKRLRNFPNIVMLKFLEILIISGCSTIDALPTDLKNMESLKVFHADGIAINPLPTTAGEVKLWNAFIRPWLSKPIRSPASFWASLPCSLTNLSLVDCNLSDDSFPIDFSKLSLLQRLNLSKNPIHGLPDCIKSLSRLQELHLNSCLVLHSVLGVPNVETLRVGDSTSLERITYQSTLSKTKYLEVTNCTILRNIQGNFELEPIEKVERGLLKNFGFDNMETMRNLKVRLEDGLLTPTKKLPIQGLYEFGIFSTFLPGGEVPSWCSDKNRGSLMSFMVPSLPNHRIRGLNVCCVYALSGIEEKIWYPHPLCIRINNMTKDLNWIYGPYYFGIPEGNEEFVWLSHWTFGNQLEGCDEVNVLVVVGDGFQIKECGIRLLYDEQEENMAQLSNTYLSWKEVIGGDLSAFQLSTGAYFLSHHGFGVRDGNFLTMGDWTTTSWSRELFGDFLQYEGKILELVGTWIKMALAAGTLAAFWCSSWPPCTE